MPCSMPADMLYAITVFPPSRQWGLRCMRNLPGPGNTPENFTAVTQQPGIRGSFAQPWGKSQQKASSCFTLSGFLTSTCSASWNADQMSKKIINNAWPSSYPLTFTWQILKPLRMTHKRQKVWLFSWKCSENAASAPQSYSGGLFMTYSFAAVAETHLMLHPMKNLHCIHFLMSKPPGERFSSCPRQVHPPLIIGH